jgi:hypothetical protein
MVEKNYDLEKKKKFFGNSYKLMVIKLCGVSVVFVGFG